MKLLSEKEIEEAALDYAEIVKYLPSEFDAFKNGALFTEQKLLTLMVEFAEWCIKNEVITLNREATKQLLEQFIDYKSKQETK